MDMHLIGPEIIHEPPGTMNYSNKRLNGFNAICTNMTQSKAVDFLTASPHRSPLLDPRFVYIG